MTVKICAIAITAVFLTVTVKKTAPFAAFCIAVAAGLAAVYLVLPDIMEIVRRIKEISVKSNIPGEYTKLLLKVLGIGYLTDFSASAAKYGYNPAPFLHPAFQWEADCIRPVPSRRGPTAGKSS